MVKDKKYKKNYICGHFYNPNKYMELFSEYYSLYRCYYCGTFYVIVKITKKHITWEKCFVKLSDNDDRVMFMDFPSKRKIELEYYRKHRKEIKKKEKNDSKLYNEMYGYDSNEKLLEQYEKLRQRHSKKNERKGKKV